MFSSLDSIEYYDIANESETIDKIKSVASNIITKIKNFVQIIKNWINSKFMKFLNMNTVSIDQTYYNNMMSVIKRVKNIDLHNIETVLMNVNTLINNEENIKKYGNVINDKLRDLEYIANNALTLKPSKENRQLTLSASILKSMKAMFQETNEKAKENPTEKKALESFIYTVN